MSVPTFNYQEIEPQIRQTLYNGPGPHIAVGTEEVDYGRVLVKVITPQFNGVSARKRQDLIWDALKTLGTNAQAVSLVLAFGTDEI